MACDVAVLIRRRYRSAGDRVIAAERAGHTFVLAFRAGQEPLAGQAVLRWALDTPVPFGLNHAEQFLDAIDGG